MFKYLDKYLTYVSILGIIIPFLLIFFLRNPKSVSFFRHSILLLLTLILVLSAIFFIHLPCIGSLVFL